MAFPPQYGNHIGVKAPEGDLCREFVSAGTCAISVAHRTPNVIQSKGLRHRG